jgi:hypothetical protein
VALYIFVLFESVDALSTQPRIQNDLNQVRVSGRKTFKTAESNEAVYEITPKARQKEAVNYLNKQVFETPTWLIDKALWNKINNPVAGDAIKSRCAEVILGGKNPFSVLVTSSCAEGAGVFVPIPTCAIETEVNKLKTRTVK